MLPQEKNHGRDACPMQRLERSRLMAQIDCLVRKMSSYGANLEVESQIGIPNSFDLLIDTQRSNHHCHVVWRKARRIGIAFDYAVSAGPKP